MTTPPLSPANTANFEMSRIIATGKINSHQVTEKAFTATQDECLALAKRFGIPAVENFSGKVQIIYMKAEQGFLVTGHFKAGVTQECRTTFQPIPQEIDETFEELLVTDKENLISLEEAEVSGKTVELLKGDEIDYGEIATQWLALALDPFPRAEGEPFEHIEHDPAETNPFLALKSINLQNNKKK